MMTGCWQNVYFGVKKQSVENIWKIIVNSIQGKLRENGKTEKQG